jgi:hypothetical protein
MVRLYGFWRVARGHQCILVHIQCGDRTEQEVDAYAFVVVSLRKKVGQGNEHLAQEPIVSRCEHRMTFIRFTDLNGTL